MIEDFPLLPVARPKITIVGDLILDRYTWGNANRMSPEAPIPVLLADHEEVRLGGAGNVGAMLAGLEADIRLIGAVGNDSDGAIIRQLVTELGASTAEIYECDDRPTTSKHRFVGRAEGRHPHQILRVDREETSVVATTVQSSLCNAVSAAVADSDAVLISDYGKGTCTSEVISSTIRICREHAIPVLIDPARNRDYGIYAGATVLKPNRTEAQHCLGASFSPYWSPDELVRRLYEQLKVESIVLTLDRDGIVFTDGNEAACLPAKQQNVYDITGAGDMVLSMLGYGLACGWPLRQSAQLANVAGGLEVQRFGVEPIHWDDIVQACQASKPTTSNKVRSPEEAVNFALRARQAGSRIVFTNGCFDLFHAGHLQTIQAAAREGDILIVAANSDQSIARIKGPNRPIIPEHQRAEILAAIDCVDCVIIWDEDTPHKLIHAIQPDTLTKGGSTEDIVCRKVVEAYGGRVVRTELVERVSTSTIVEQISKTNSN